MCIFVLTHLRVSCTCYASLPVNPSIYIFSEQNIFLHNHSTVIKIRECNTDTTLLFILNIWSILNFTNYPNIILYIFPPLPDPIQEHTSYLVGMSLPFPLNWNSSSVFIFHDLGILKSANQLFRRLSLNLSLSDVSS